MKIVAPLNLSTQELECFNKLVKPQLKELYSYNYKKFKFNNINIFISKEIKLNIEKIKDILIKFPRKDLAVVSDIYFVCYGCRDDMEEYLTSGRTLPLIHKT